MIDYSDKGREEFYKDTFERDLEEIINKDNNSFFIRYNEN